MRNVDAYENNEMAFELLCGRKDPGDRVNRLQHERDVTSELADCRIANS